MLRRVGQTSIALALMSVASSLPGAVSAEPGEPAPQVVNPADVAGSYFIAADGFETRVVHPTWNGDRLVVEDIRFMGNYPLILAIPAHATGVGVQHPAAMAGGILTYSAAGLFGGSCSQTVVFTRSTNLVTGGIHAVMTFDGPPEGSPSVVQAKTRTPAEWKAEPPLIRSDPGEFPG